MSLMTVLIACWQKMLSHLIITVNLYFGSIFGINHRCPTSNPPESKCLFENIKKVVCTDQKIYILTQTGVLNSIPASPFKQIQLIYPSLETLDVVDFYVNRDKIITVTVA